MSDFSIGALLRYWRERRGGQPRQVFASDTLPVPVDEAVTVAIRPAGGIPSEEAVGTPTLNDDMLSSVDQTAVLIQAGIILLGEKVDEGQMVVGVSIPWFQILEELERDPNFLQKVSPRQLEEIIAGAYTRAGWPEVVLTPRSGDGGRDIIASKPGQLAIRIYDEAKRFIPPRLVKATDVRALLGVLDINPNVSKGVITTTSDFAPGIPKELKAFTPYRLELRNGQQLRDWLMKPQ